MSGRRLVVGAGAVLLAVGTGVLVASGSASASTPLCSSGQLVPRYESTGRGAGQYYDVWQLVDVGGTCRTTGYVGALNFGADGRPLPTTVTRVPVAHTTVVLAHGQHASWTFHYPSPGILGCVPEPAVAMIVTPPDNTVPVLARRGEPACRGVVDAYPLAPGG